MQEEVNHIKTFELVRKWEYLKEYWDALQWVTNNLLESSIEFQKRCLPVAIGRELNIKESKDKNCARVYYNQNNDVVLIKAFDIAGYIVFELNLEFSGKVSGEVDNEERELKSHLENVQYIDELYDAKKAVIQAAPDNEDIVIYAEKVVWHFKKISMSQYDIFMQDPIWLYYNTFGVEKRFYDLGYKLVAVTETDIDGIITRFIRFYYDSKGILLKRIFMGGTPWGGVVTYNEEYWECDYEKNIVTRKDIDIRRNFLGQLFQYKLDEQGRIRQRKDLGFPSNERAVENLVHTRTLRYSYGEDGKLREITPVFCVPTMCSERIVYEYDKRGRLIAERNYSANDKPVSEETYRYIGDRKVEVTYSLFTFPEI